MSAWVVSFQPLPILARVKQDERAWIVDCSTGYWKYKKIKWSNVLILTVSVHTGVSRLRITEKQYGKQALTSNGSIRNRQSWSTDLTHRRFYIETCTSSCKFYCTTHPWWSKRGSQWSSWMKHGSSRWAIGSLVNVGCCNLFRKGGYSRTGTVTGRVYSLEGEN